MSLLQRGTFQLASGTVSEFKIDCDYLTDEDWECAAFMLARMTWPFSRVWGVPTGGNKLAECMSKYVMPTARPVTLLVDDVWTTGGSMNKFMREQGLNRIRGDAVKGAVLFARGPVPEYVTALFTIHDEWKGK